MCVVKSTIGLPHHWAASGVEREMRICDMVSEVVASCELNDSEHGSGRSARKSSASLCRLRRAASGGVRPSSRSTRSTLRQLRNHLRTSSVERLIADRGRTSSRGPGECEVITRANVLPCRAAAAARYTPAGRRRPGQRSARVRARAGKLLLGQVDRRLVAACGGARLPRSSAPQRGT